MSNSTKYAQSLNASISFMILLSGMRVINGFSTEFVPVFPRETQYTFAGRTMMAKHYMMAGSFVIFLWEPCKYSLINLQLSDFPGSGVRTTAPNPGSAYVASTVLHLYMYETFMNRLMKPSLLFSNFEVLKGSDFGLVYF